MLIVAALNDEELAELHTYAMGLGLEVLVEVHDADELERALTIDAKLIGVNNRDLRTFEVDLGRTEEIAAVFPFDEERVLISESGITGQARCDSCFECGCEGYSCRGIAYAKRYSCGSNRIYASWHCRVWYDDESENLRIDGK